MNSGVPRTIPVAVSFSSSGPALRSLASPKSMTTANSLPSGCSQIITFSGFRSRCTMVMACATLRPAAISEAQRTACASGTCPSRLVRSASSSPSTKGMTT